MPSRRNFWSVESLNWPFFSSSILHLKPLINPIFTCVDPYLEYVSGFIKFLNSDPVLIRILNTGLHYEKFPYHAFAIENFLMIALAIVNSLPTRAWSCQQRSSPVLSTPWPGCWSSYAIMAPCFVSIRAWSCLRRSSPVLSTPWPTCWSSYAIITLVLSTRAWSCLQRSSPVLSAPWPACWSSSSASASASSSLA